MSSDRPSAKSSSSKEEITREDTQREVTREDTIEKSQAEGFSSFASFDPLVAEPPASEDQSECESTPLHARDSLTLVRTVEVAEAPSHYYNTPGQAADPRSVRDRSVSLVPPVVRCCSSTSGEGEFYAMDYQKSPSSMSSAELAKDEVDIARELSCLSFVSYSLCLQPQPNEKSVRRDPPARSDLLPVFCRIVPRINHLSFACLPFVWCGGRGYSSAVQRAELS